MKFVSNGNPKDDARLTFEGLGVPLYTLDKIPDLRVHLEKDVSPEEPEICKKPITILDMSPRAINVCRRNDIITIHDLLLYTEEEFGTLRNCGKGTVAAVKELLQLNGLSFRESAEGRIEPLPHRR